MGSLMRDIFVPWGSLAFLAGAWLAFPNPYMAAAWTALCLTMILSPGILSCYHRRNLETIYRILSFVALGVLLFAVSCVYTRFQDQLKRLL